MSLQETIEYRAANYVKRVANTNLPVNIETKLGEIMDSDGIRDIWGYIVDQELGFNDLVDSNNNIDFFSEADTPITIAAAVLEGSNFNLHKYQSRLEELVRSSLVEYIKSMPNGPSEVDTSKDIRVFVPDDNEFEDMIDEISNEYEKYLVKQIYLDELVGAVDVCAKKIVKSMIY